MKIFTHLSSPVNAPAVESSGASVVWPDSCWLQSRRPLYIPDFAPRFIALPAAAVKIGRLGKNISPRFASRYEGALTMALIILPETSLRNIGEGLPLSATDYCFDNAVVIGNWCEPETFPDGLQLQLHIPDPDPLLPPRIESRELSASLLSSQRAHDLISSFSRYNTLKMGDVMLLPCNTPPIPLEENLFIVIKSSCREILATRFK